MHVTGAVDADGELELDVGAGARACDNRDRARQVRAERVEKLLKTGDDRVLADDRDMRPGEERAGARLDAREQDD